MTSPDGSPDGRHLWSISVPRGNSGTGVGVSVVFTGMLVFALVAARGVVPVIFTVVLWFFLFAGLAGVYSFTKRTL